MRISAVGVIVVLLAASSSEGHAGSLQEEVDKNADRGAVVSVRVNHADPAEESGNVWFASDVPLYSADRNRQAVVVPAGSMFLCRYGERQLDRIAVRCSSVRLPSAETASVNGVVNRMTAKASACPRVG